MMQYNLNISIKRPNRGEKAIRRFAKAFISKMEQVKFVVHHQVESSDGIVMNERTDYLTFNGKQIELPVMGIFELKNGKIKAWRDYFDMSKLKEVMV
jgi:limonene-1,2-epoxide hydrolase